MQNATEFAAEWTAIIIRNANGGLAELHGQDALTGYLGTMGCHLDEVCDDLMREGVSWEVIHALDVHAQGDNCDIYAGTSGPFLFRPTMREAELFETLRALAVCVGLPGMLTASEFADKFTHLITRRGDLADYRDLLREFADALEDAGGDVSEIDFGVSENGRVGFAYDCSGDYAEWHYEAGAEEICENLLTLAQWAGLA